MDLKLTHKAVKHLLPFKVDALKPFISSHAINLHFGKHHKGYVDKYNTMLVQHKDLQNKNLEQVLSYVNREMRCGNFTRRSLFQNGAQVFNHDFFWKSLKLDCEKIPNFAISKELFVETGMSQFGSGWLWIVKLFDSNIDLCITPNEESPFFCSSKIFTVIHKIPIESTTAVAACDLWEHSYYPNYANKRQKYLEDIFDHLLNWDFMRMNMHIKNIYH